ncbi:hypothetical protein [Azotobacter beijerinckii]|uniref:hypothetical protein n=1 Tax=Azotobacter beijerinckii TaxID=170623 RepID=UPI002954B403|nr:hypothetical protein [Azotobacter beijerinckii]MDV7209941.1 hypothetical protein [Azotobacter beijerinckii]
MADNPEGWLASIPDAIDSIGRLFVVIWDKSPALAWFVMVMTVLFPFYLVHTWSNRPERDLDRREAGARRRYKERQAQQIEGCEE